MSKSALEWYEKCFDEEFISEQIREWLSGLSNAEQAMKAGLMVPIDFDQVLMDSTCVKVWIHFPVDWVLLRDAARSLLLAIKTIRAQGLKHRMIEPAELLKQMNGLCIRMTHCRRKRGGKKHRKATLRTMKRLSHRISSHAERYRALLANEWEKTEWSEIQAQQVLRRIDHVLEQLPKAIEQAHERIIGESAIPSSLL